MQQGDYARAAIAYEYIVYAAPDAVTEALGCLGKARAYKRMQDYEGALKSLSRVNYRPLSDTLHYEARSEMAFLLYLTGRFAEADQQFKQMDFFLPNLELKRQTYYLRVLTLNELKRWEEAATATREWIAWFDAPQATKDSLDAMVVAWYEDVPRFKKHKRAEVLSAFPGLGHWYAGYFGEGAVSILVTVGALGFATMNVFLGNYLTAFTLGSGLLQMFWFGSARRARFLAKKKNYERLRNFNNPIRERVTDWHTLWLH